MPQPQRNIVLVGFMGTGKSSVGRKLAAALGMTFLDMDARIEDIEGRPVSRIFNESGEPYFRRLERQLVRELAAGRGRVVATGGGIVLDPDNVSDFSRTGLVVCLRATPETVLRRVQHETHRPLLSEGDKMLKIRELLARRQPLYDAIPCGVDTDSLSVDEVAARVLEQYRAQATGGGRRAEHGSDR